MDASLPKCVRQESVITTVLLSRALRLARKACKAMQSWSKSHGRAQHSTPRAKTDRSRIANEKSVLKTFTNVRLLYTVACTYIPDCHGSETTVLGAGVVFIGPRNDDGSGIAHARRVPGVLQYSCTVSMTWWAHRRLQPSPRVLEGGVLTTPLLDYFRALKCLWGGWSQPPSSTMWHTELLGMVTTRCSRRFGGRKAPSQRHCVEQLVRTYSTS